LQVGRKRGHPVLLVERGTYSTTETAMC
jgi:hypothetical protein